MEAARILNQLGIVYRSQEYFVESYFAHVAALDELTSVIEQDDFSVQFQKARTRYLMGKRKKDSAARVAIDQIVDPSNFLPRPLAVRGIGRRDYFGDFDRRSHHLNVAIELLSDLRQQSQENTSCEFLIGCCFRESGDTDRALETFQNLVEKHPDNPHFRFELIETFRTVGDPRQDRRGERFPEEDEVKNQLLALEHADWLVQRFPNAPRYGLAPMHVLHRLGHTFQMPQ